MDLWEFPQKLFKLRSPSRFASVRSRSKKIVTSFAPFARLETSENDCASRSVLQLLDPDRTLNS